MVADALVSYALISKSLVLATEIPDPLIFVAMVSRALIHPILRHIVSTYF